MQKMLIVDPNKCTGCRTCEVVCSARHEGGVNPLRSRIHVIKWEWEGFTMPFFCQQCRNAPCITVCPVRALSRDEEEYGRIKIDRDKCIGCKLCIAVCPFGGMGWDPVSNKVIKCDFCHGDPMCVKFCTTEAIRFEYIPEVSIKKKRTMVSNIKESIKGEQPELIAI